MNKNRTLYKGIILLLVFIIQCSTYAYSQSQLRQIQYATRTTNVFSVPLETDMSLITDMDLTKMSSQLKKEIVNLILNSEFDIETTKTYPELPLYSGHYQRMIGKTVSDKNGVTLFDREDNIVAYENNVNTISVNLTSDMVEYFGLKCELDVDLIKIKDQFKLDGFNVLINERGVFSAINDDMEYYLDQKNLISELRIFKEGKLLSSTWRHFMRVGEKNTIPLKFINTSFETLFSGIRCRKSQIVDYEYYIVKDENGEVILSQVNNINARTSNPNEIKIRQYDELLKRNFDIEISPNPCSNTLYVKVPYFLLDYLELKIVNTLGIQVYYENGVKSGSNININVSDLKNGMYILMVGSGEEWKSVKFVKQ